jgi:hypothetical protein
VSNPIPPAAATPVAAAPMDAFLRKCRRLVLGMLYSLHWRMDGNEWGV